MMILSFCLAEGCDTTLVKRRGRYVSLQLFFIFPRTPHEGQSLVGVVYALLDEDFSSPARARLMRALKPLSEGHFLASALK